MTRLWARLARRAPRRLSVSAAGKLLLLLSIALGVAAINTGHNGMFLAWGLAMGVMVVSGILSEMSLRALSAQLAPLGPLRVGTLSRIELTLHNASPSFGAYALESQVTLAPAASHAHSTTVALPLVLTLPATASERLGQSLRPARRGALRVDEVEVTTSYPFGFFAKARRLAITPQLVWVWPERLLGAQPVTQLLAQVGEVASTLAGAGDEFFALRPWRPGEDLRHLIWRRLARTGRFFVVESAAHQTQQVVLVACVDAHASPFWQERAIAAIGTLAEDLLSAGMGVGLRVNGRAVSARVGTGSQRAQMVRVLDALAQLDVGAALAPSREPARNRAPELALVGTGLVAPPAHMPSIALATLAQHEGGKERHEAPSSREGVA